jgi:hypothetical protein
MNIVTVEFMGHRYTFANFDIMCRAVHVTQQHTTPRAMVSAAIKVEKIGKRETVECTVDEEWGTISPTFKEVSKHREDDQFSSTSGNLKYFGAIAGKEVRMTIEVIE